MKNSIKILHKDQIIYKKLFKEKKTFFSYENIWQISTCSEVYYI